MLSYEEQFAAPLALLDEISQTELTVEGVMRAEETLFPWCVEALVAVALDAGKEDLDTLVLIQFLGRDLLRDGQRRRAAALALVEDWFRRAEAQELALN